MKRNFHMGSFLSGAAAALMLLSVTVPVLAAGGSFSPGQAGVSLFDRTRIETGENFTAENGEQVPAVVTYTDAKGGKTNYIAVRELKGLFDVASIAWDSKNACVAFAPRNTGSGITIIQDGEIVSQTGDGDGVTITIGSDESDVPSLPDVPTLGTTAGPFTEIDPATVDTSRQAVYSADGMKVQSKYGLNGQIVYCNAGDTLVFIITNNGKTTQYMNVRRCPAVSYGQPQQFTSVGIEPGKTLTRAFTCSADADELARSLEWEVNSYPGGSIGTTDITVTAEIYQAVRAN